MRVTQSTRTYTLRGSFAEIVAFLDRCHDGGMLFDYTVTGWTADPLSNAGHIECHCEATITPDDDDNECHLRLLLPYR